MNSNVVTNAVETAASIPSATDWLKAAVQMLYQDDVSPKNEATRLMSLWTDTFLAMKGMQRQVKVKKFRLEPAIIGYLDNKRGNPIPIRHEVAINVGKVYRNSGFSGSVRRKRERELAA